MRAWPSRYGPTLPITSTPSSVITTGLLLCSTISSLTALWRRRYVVDIISDWIIYPRHLYTVGLFLKSTRQL